jgi:hypothetical protein
MPMAIDWRRWLDSRPDGMETVPSPPGGFVEVRQADLTLYRSLWCQAIRPERLKMPGRKHALTL